MTGLPVVNAAPAPTRLAVEGVHSHLRVERTDRPFRCYPCSRFQPPGLLVWVSSFMHDTRHRADELDAMGPQGWNMDFSAWCVPCAKLISRPREPQPAANAGWFHRLARWMLAHG